MYFKCENCGGKYYTEEEIDVKELTYKSKEKGKVNFLVCYNCGYKHNEQVYDNRVNRNGNR